MAGETQKNELPHRVRDRVNEAPCDFQAPFELLNKYGSQLKRLRCSKLQTEPRNGLKSQVLSAVTIMSLAEMILSHPTYQATVDASELAKSFGVDFLSCWNAEHLKRVLLLLDASRKFSKWHYDEAEELLMLALSGSVDGHPIETVLTFYGRFLRGKIDVERGRFDPGREVELVDVEQAVTDLKAAVLECEQKLPFSQISHFTGMQTILDTMAAAERIHFIDFGRKLQSYWIILMDALANRKDCNVKLLKITAVCSPRDNVEEVGKLLSSFAKSMNLPFAFHIVYSESGELEKDHLQLEAGEAVAVYMEFCLVSSLSGTTEVEALLRGIKSLNPDVMVVLDYEIDSSESAFTGRFKVSLFLSCAMFDTLEDCLERDSQYRRLAEKLNFERIICNSVLSDEDGGFNRCYKIDFWREYFSKFGILESELSRTSMDQARLMIGECPSWSSCTMSMNGKSMLLGWNGIMLRSLSAWKFQ